MIAINKLNEILEQLKNQGTIDESIGKAKAPERLKILSYSTHAAKMAHIRGIEEGQLIALAQQYVDEAIIMMVQGDGRRSLYISLEGNVAVLVEKARVLTIYTSANFDAAIRRIIEEAHRCRL